ncbi:PP0621 family protein [Variovorax sp. J22R24]|uniref:PP0621 family protein n=1 Tax=Variovorax gracilis TaxID=3053502 RepID=UPI0025760D35|nr:PP0621 family protein [Variovorax sp. J22R24]MDM0105312.1 PP0621 family protein [Variovorax sp. J22R24]
MKYLLVLAVVFIAIWIWRKNRREEMQSRPPPPAKPPAVGAPQAMVRCAHCGLHLPAADAITGPAGVYCSAAHRQAAGGK